MIFGGVGTFVKRSIIAKRARIEVMIKSVSIPYFAPITGPKAIAKAKLRAIKPPIIAIALPRIFSSTRSEIIAVITEPIAPAPCKNLPNIKTYISVA